jgi:serine/threonine protein kinase
MTSIRTEKRNQDVGKYFTKSGRKQIIKRIESSGPLFDKLPSSECNTLFDIIEYKDKLGEGADGVVYSLRLKKSNAVSDYVLKVTGPINAIFTIKVGNDEKTLMNFFMKYETLFNMLPGDDNFLNSIVEMNNLSENLQKPQLKSGMVLKFPVRPIKDFLVKEELFIQKNDNSGDNIEIPKSSYLCERIISENVISTYIGQFFENGTVRPFLNKSKQSDYSIHFLASLSFLVCSEGDEEPVEGNALEETLWNIPEVQNFSRDYDYMLLERIDNNIEGISKCIPDKYYEYLFMQAIFSLCLLQKHEIVHNDLHLGNLFVKYIDENTTYHSQKLISAEYFSYTVEKITFYIPFIPLILKIGDFGLAQKYSEPQILATNIVSDMFEIRHLIPNFYSSITDVVPLVFNFLNISGDTAIITKSAEWIFKGKKEQKRMITFNKRYSKIYTEYYKYFEHISAINLLKYIRDIRPTLFKKPKSGKIINLGTIY